MGWAFCVHVGGRGLSVKATRSQPAPDLRQTEARKEQMAAQQRRKLGVGVTQLEWMGDAATAPGWV